MNADTVDLTKPINKLHGSSDKKKKKRKKSFEH